MNGELYNKWSRELQEKIDKDERSRLELLELADGMSQAFKSTMYGSVQTGTLDMSDNFLAGHFYVEPDLKMPFAVKVTFKRNNGNVIIEPVVPFLAQRDGRDFKVSVAGTTAWKLVPYGDRKSPSELKHIVDLIDAPLDAEVKKFLKG